MPEETQQPRYTPEERAEGICRGSFKIGTACGECPRCRKAGYGPEQKAAAIEAEKERTKDFPADRVKPRNPAPVVVVQATPEESV